MPISPFLEKPLDYVSDILTSKVLPNNADPDKPIPLITKDEFNNLKAVLGYCKREGFFGFLANLIHKIWNAVKSVFHQSDWQIASKTLLTVAERIKPIMQELDLPLLSDDEVEKEQEINSMLELVVNSVTDFNKELKPIEEKLVPMVEQLLSLLNQDKLAAADVPTLVGDIKRIFAPRDKQPLGTYFLDGLTQNGYAQEGSVPALEKIFETIDNRHERV